MQKTYSLTVLSALFYLFIGATNFTESPVTGALIHKEVKMEVRKALSGILQHPAYEISHLEKNQRYEIITEIYATSREKIGELQEKKEVPEGEPTATSTFGVVYLDAAKAGFVPSPEEHPALIQSLRDDKAFSKTLHGFLNAVKKYESAQLGFWHGEQYPEKNHIQKLYSKKGHPYSAKDTSAHWQEFFTDAQHLKCVAQLIIGVATVFSCSSYVDKCSKSPFYGKAVVSLSSAVLGSYAQVVIFPHEKEFCRLLNYLHEKTNGIAAVIHTLDKVTESLRTHPELNQLEHAAVFKALQTRSFSPRLTTLIDLLRTSTFKGDPSFFSRKGRVRAAYALINELKDELAPLFMALGEIDAYLAHASTSAKASSYVKTTEGSDGACPQ
jgi:hypothetical protein